MSYTTQTCWPNLFNQYKHWWSRRLISTIGMIQCCFLCWTTVYQTESNCACSPNFSQQHWTQVLHKMRFRPCTWMRGYHRYISLNHSSWRFLRNTNGRLTMIGCTKDSVLGCRSSTWDSSFDGSTLCRWSREQAFRWRLKPPLSDHSKHFHGTTCNWRGCTLPLENVHHLS
jgi:hypothetical protein